MLCICDIFLLEGIATITLLKKKTTTDFNWLKEKYALINLYISKPSEIRH